MNSRVVCEDVSGGREPFPIRCVNDADSASLEKFEYITVMDAFEGSSNDERISIDSAACSCIGNVCSQSCSCSSKVFQADGRAIVGCLESTIFECGPACACSSSPLQCEKRVTQRGCRHRVEVFRTGDRRGWGLRARERISRGTFIGEYTGHVVRAGELYEGDYTFETMLDGADVVIDASKRGNVTRFINHSCNPNVFAARVVRKGDALVHICIFTLYNLAQFQELTIDYGELWWGDKPGVFCRCASTVCKFGNKSLHS